MSSDDTRMYLFAIPGQMFGAQAYGSDPTSALASYYDGGMCGGEVQPEGPWTVVMVEVPPEAEDEIRDQLEEAGCEDYDDVISDVRTRYPNAQEHAVEITPTVDDGYRYRVL